MVVVGRMEREEFAVECVVRPVLSDCVIVKREEDRSDTVVEQDMFEFAFWNEFEREESE